MAITVGTQLGSYEITALLGKGGMGEVYRARDKRLQRDVALKLLPGDFISDSDRLARFEREAQVLASLNHSNIAAIYGIEESKQTPALVIELVDGPTLAERIAQGPIPIEEVLSIAGQIAEAMEYAHEAAVIHRDLKPANIKLTAAGRVKVLDFGLAKALGEDSRTGSMSNSPTLSLAATQAGCGTADPRHLLTQFRGRTAPPRLRRKITSLTSGRSKQQPLFTGKFGGERGGVFESWRL
jgi:serine/threonine protein kinase